MSDQTSLWKCSFCDRDFKNQAGLMSHERTHVKNEPIAKPETAVHEVVRPSGTADLGKAEEAVKDMKYIDKMMLPDISEPQPEVKVEPVKNADQQYDEYEYDEYYAYGRELEEMVTVEASTGLYKPTPQAMANPALSGAAPVLPTPTATHMIGFPTFDLVVKVKKLPHYGDLPDIKRATPGSAAYDLYAAIDEDLCIAISEWQLIPTGLCMEVPPGWKGTCVPRSGLAASEGITVLNTPGVIDSDYRGEIKVNLVNNSRKRFFVKPGMRIAQIMFERVYNADLQVVEELSETSRGSGGFGSSGLF